MTRERRLTWLLLAGLLVLATGVRLYRLDTRVLWFDEAVSMLVSKAEATGALVAARDDTHPPLYHLLLHGWTLWLPGEYGARLLSVAAGVLSVWVVFALGCRLRDRTAGLVAGALFAFCPLHVWYSQEVRMYAVQTLFICLSWLWLLRALECQHTGSWLIYALATSASLYTQYTSLFSLLAQNVFVFWTRRESGLPVRMWLRAQGAVGILFLPWLPMLWHHWEARTFGYWLRPLAWTDPLQFFALLSGAIQKNPGPYWPWMMVTGAVLAATLWVWRPVALIAWLFLPVALLAAQSVGANVFLARSLVFVAPAFALLVGVAVAERRVLWIGVGLLLAANVFALRMYFVAPNDWIRSPLRDAALQVADGFRPGDIVVHTSRFSYRPFQWYIGDRVMQGLVRETEAMPALFQVIGDSRLPGKPERFRRVWLVEWPDFQQGTTGPPRISLREQSR